MNGLINLIIFAVCVMSRFAESHPFVGEHAKATSIERDDGTLTMRLQEAQLSASKYDNLINRRLEASPPLTAFEQLVETVFGKSEKKRRFEESVWETIKVKQRRNRGGDSKRRLGDRHVEATLETIGGAMWTGTVYMGRVHPMDVVFDTGSDWLVIEAHHCENCEGNTYDVSGGKQVGVEISERVYGSASLEGFEHTDTVCIAVTTCITNFEYFAIYSQTGIKEPIDGILGLSREKWFHQS